MKWLSGAVLLASTVLLFMMLNATSSKATKDALLTKLRGVDVFKGNMQIAGMFLETALGSLLAGKEGNASWLRMLAIGMLLLTMSLGAIGWRTDTAFGLSELPWDHYERTVHGLATSLKSHRIDPMASDAREEREARRILLARVETVQSPAWKYIYTAAHLLWIVLVNHVMLFLSVLGTRHFVRETQTSNSWSQKAGL